MNDYDEYYEIEEYISNVIAIGGNGFWYPLPDTKSDIPEMNSNKVDKLKKEGRNVRLIRVSREVCS